MRHEHFEAALMPHIYDHIFETYRVVGAEDSSIVDQFADQAQWLNSPGCLFQRHNLVLSSRIKTEGMLKAGLFVSVVLKGSGCARSREGASEVHYSDDSISVMALRQSTLWNGDSPGGAHMQAAGLAFPVSSLQRLGLADEFIKLFGPRNPNVFVATLQASPRVRAIAVDMISPLAEGRAAELLLSAHATEILARTMLALQGNENVGLVSDRKRLRLQALGEMIKSDLRHPWTIAELARHAGLGRRIFNVKFHRMYGVSAADYLRRSRLEAAREALLYQGLSVTEAGYSVGYANSANFSTAFRKHFGYVPSRCHRDKLS
jgi:AraC-like DNA-binding protein